MEQDRLKWLQVEAAMALMAKDFCRACALSAEALEFDDMLNDDDFYAFIALIQVACGDQEKKCPYPAVAAKITPPVFEDDEDYLESFL